MGKRTMIDHLNKDLANEFSAIIVTTDATVYKEGSQMISFQDLAVGDSLVVMGVRKGDDVEARTK